MIGTQLWLTIRTTQVAMQPPVIIIGLGEMGSVFSRGFLRKGHPVYPVTRTMTLAQAEQQMPDPALVVVAVGEKDLPATLAQLRAAWKTKLVLLQNELLPDDWLQHGIDRPTVISVWFEKKQGRDSKVILPSPAFGPHAERLRQALGSIRIPVRVLKTEAELLHELVLKNVYILTTNIAGLKTGGTVGKLWEKHRPLAETIAREVIRIQEKLVGRQLDDKALIEGMLRAFEGDPDHNCMGRSAPARLQRALLLADKYGLDTPQLHVIDAEQLPASERP